MARQSESPKPIEVARIYWNLPRKQRCLRRVAEDLRLENPEDKAVQNRLGRCLRLAEELGLVSHEVRADLGETPHSIQGHQRVGDIEHRLQQHFSLRGIVVLDVLPSQLEREADSTISDAEVRKQLVDDRLHRHLGLWGAQVLLSLLRPGDVLGTGGGRGAHHTASWLAHFRLKPQDRPARVVSLTGKMGVRERAPITVDKPAANMDADIVGSLLASHLASESQFRINTNIADTLSQKRREQIDREMSSISVALLSIGALEQNHHFVRNADCDRLRSLAPDLKELSQLVHRFESLVSEPDTNTTACAGDVCGCLYAIESEDLKKFPQSRKLEQLLKRINKQTTSASPKKLTSICARGSVLGVAGGVRKARAIGHVLAKGWITHLVTDVNTARAIWKNVEFYSKP